MHALHVLICEISEASIVLEITARVANPTPVHNQTVACLLDAGPVCQFTSTFSHLPGSSRVHKRSAVASPILATAVEMCRLFGAGTPAFAPIQPSSPNVEAVTTRSEGTVFTLKTRLAFSRIALSNAESPL